MSKYVREIDSIQELRRTPTSDAAAAHVRTPTGQSGIFVPMDGDPFGNGDDGAVAVQASDGTWWARKNLTPVLAEWFSSIQEALNFASAESRPLDLQGGTHTIPPGLQIPDGTEVMRGALRIDNAGDYDVAVRIGANCNLYRVTLDQSDVLAHNGNGRGFSIQGNESSLVNCVAIGERSVQANNDLNHPFRPTGNDISLVRCKALDAAGSGFRPKETERLKVENCISINYQDKGFGYDSGNNNVGSISVDGFYAESDTTEGSAQGFLIDPAGNYINEVVLDNIHLANQTGSGAKLQYIRNLKIGRFYSDADTNYGLRIDHIDEAHMGHVKLTNRFKIEPPCGPVVIDKVEIDCGGDIDCFQHGGSDSVMIRHATLRNPDLNGFRIRIDRNNYPNRELVCERLIFEGTDSSDNVFFDPNDNYDIGHFFLGQYRIIDGRLAQGGDDQRSIVRTTSGRPVIHSTKRPDNGMAASRYDHLPTGVKCIHTDAAAGEVMFWYWNANTSSWDPGPSYV